LFSFGDVVSRLEDELEKVERGGWSRNKKDLFIMTRATCKVITTADVKGTSGGKRFSIEN